MDNISLAVAFTGGLLSFLSPCVLPMVPVYLASLVGPELFAADRSRLRAPTFFHSLAFVIGFSLVFTALGAIAGLTAFAINPSVALLNKVSGSLLILFGFYLLAALKVKRLNFARRFTPVPGTGGYLRSFLVGATFSLAWTACVGPLLAGILTIALNTATAWQGAYLLAIYSLGLGLPFLVIGAAFDSMTPVLKRMQRYSRAIHIAGGLLLIVIGVLVLTNRMLWLSSFTF